MLLRAKDEDRVQLDVSLSQLKKLYIALFRQLRAAGLDGLDDVDEDDMLLTLQTYLQKRAAAQGVDCTNHTLWEEFLGLGPRYCEDRGRGRGRDDD